MAVAAAAAAGCVHVRSGSCGDSLTCGRPLLGMNKEHGRHCERNLWWFLLLQRCCSDSIAGPVTPRLDWPHRVHVLLHATRRGTGLWWCGWRSSTHLGAHGVASWSHRRLRLVRSLRRSNTRTHWHKQRHTDREAHRQRSTQTKTHTEAQPHTQPHTCVIHTEGERARHNPPRTAWPCGCCPRGACPLPSFTAFAGRRPRGGAPGTMVGGMAGGPMRTGMEPYIIWPRGMPGWKPPGAGAPIM